MRLALCLLLAGCGASSTEEAVATQASQRDVSVLARHCSRCHVPPSPHLHSRRMWPGVVDRMNRHRLDAGFAAFTDAERREILEYLSTHAKS